MCIKWEKTFILVHGCLFIPHIGEYYCVIDLWLGVQDAGVNKTEEMATPTLLV